MRFEGFGVGTARNRVQHRRFHFHEAMCAHEFTHARNDLAAGFKAFAAFVVDDQVHITLAAALFGIAEPLMLVGERANGLRHEAQRFHAHGEFAAVRAEKRPFGGDDVSQVQGLKQGVGFVTDLRRGDEVLHRAREVAHGGKARLTHHAL